MAFVRIVVGLWLGVSPCARAQRVVAPLEGLGRSPSPTVSPGAPVFAVPAPGLLALSSPRVSAAPAIRAPAPTPLDFAGARAAVAEFSAFDVRSAPASVAREAGDELMARVLGGPAAEARVPAAAAADRPSVRASLPRPTPARRPAAGGSVHLLSRPLHETVELGLVARVLHYALETAFQFVKAALAWHATGSPTAGLGMLAFDLIKLPPMITAQSLADLNVRYWWRKLATLKRLAGTPGVTRIRVLTTGQAEFSGILARRRENTGLIFLDAEGGLPAEVAGLGAPIPIADLGGRRARLVLTHDGVSELAFWTPSLAELLAGDPIPAEIARAWRARLDDQRKEKTPLQRIFDFKKEKDLRVEAYLEDGAGGETPLGTIAYGHAVKHLIGLSRRDRVAALFGRAPTGRTIRLSDTVVERDGVRAVEGAARRAWRRLTGSLIVRP